MKQPTILLVDDSDHLRAVYADYLTFNGFLVLEARDGAEGVRLASEHRPDLILIDLAMPVLDGFTATRRIRENPELAGTPVIACSGQVREVEARASSSGAFAGFIAKPAGPRVVLAEVLRVLERAGSWQIA